jgi:Phosphate-induced protein 1 conserved region
MKSNSVLVAGALMLGALLATAVADDFQAPDHDPDVRPDGRGNAPRGYRRAKTHGAVVQGNGINYHGGPVMQGPTHVYFIWYGDWTKDAGANAILTDFANNIGGSPYFNINTTYGDTTGNVVNSVLYVTSTSDPGTLGTSLSDNNIWTLVKNSLSSGNLPLDANGVYFVLTAPGVAETSGFLTQYCGWHTYGTYNSTNIKFAFVGDADGPSLGNCAAQVSSSPNGDPAADAMASVMGHELEESVTDPLLNAWYDSNGNENADKCAWTFGSTYSANGAAANMLLGSRNYLIQRDWLNANGGSCAQSYSSTATADFSVSVSPGSQTVAPGGTSANYTLTDTPSGGFSGTVNWTVTPPAGITASSVSPSGTFKLTAAANTIPGNYTIPITGTSGSLVHSTSAILVVSQNRTFSISISPSSNTVTRPASGNVQATYEVTVTGSGGFSSNVSLSVSGGATGIAPSLSPTTIPGGSGQSTLTVTVNQNSHRTTRTLTVTARGGGINRTASATITVQ